MKKKTKRLKLTDTPSLTYNPRVDFGKIRQLRKERGMNQTQAGKAAGWDQRIWSRIERGKNPDLRLTTLATVARVLGCKVADLLTE